ncbi:hypothetical protein [Acanthamoeba castellanii mimivirus]|uniref:Uncharacterized protein L242 n=5 Tax=Mimivirus TaxID=315393 RepID=YL242_MIMIV|nr:hypothetical protein MIMI_gp0264 [Acanthamoeba polyphaga mimivirus]Q5UPS9.1 RecName: Full=Uncharacterized protein L242 [Acanthamoeba polyphaga mimivirus]AHA45631.1 hypothetical protein HIRU_S725 [Hirudovirus strain Sangsue]ALR83812.1 hypothetical protein [Niemeyer virus]AMK61822.1 hypothetical protein [Samba virus]AMZ02688.1 hypothetical protein [Mimivirus Bombay]QTF49148.1 hypothetical protein [Mimivirus reunion]WMV61591.1 hypothetical protein qu_253 [Mimivirus sp.]BAV61333.1 hypothetic
MSDWCYLNSEEKDKLIDKLYKKLIKKGRVVCEVSDIRHRIYKRLEYNGHKFERKIIGYEPGVISLSREHNTELEWNLWKIAGWINSKRITKEELELACETHNMMYPKRKVKVSSIEEAFDGELSIGQIYYLIQDKWKKVVDKNPNPFDYCNLRDTIVKIKLVK